MTWISRAADYTTPARFVGKAGAGFKEISVETLRGERIAVVRGSSHEAFVRDFFGVAKIVPFDTAEQARVALKNGDADLVIWRRHHSDVLDPGHGLEPVL